MNILGVSAFYHDSAACLVQDGEIVAAAQEERFTRIRHDAAFPEHAIAWCLQQGGVGKGELDLAVFYEKPLTHFLRIMRTHAAATPKSFAQFVRAVPAWTREKLWVRLALERTCRAQRVGVPRRIGFTEHHAAHAASAYYPSPFDDAAILTIDGVGEWTTTSIAHGRGNVITPMQEIRFPHSLGLLYSAFTYFTGFKINSGEYKLMGLAPYGRPIYADVIKEKLISFKRDGSFAINTECFDFLGGLRMTNRKFEWLFDGPPRVPETPITQRELDIAASIQAVMDEAVSNLAHEACARTGTRNLCMAGGVALNCVSNGRLMRDGVVDRLWVQPAAGDAGGALGAALFGWHQTLGRQRGPRNDADAMEGSLLGPQFGDDDIEAFLVQRGLPYERLAASEWAVRLADLLAHDRIIGFFQGRMEYGPRALGSRSILADARNPRMRSLLNEKVKLREAFRPFAPAILRERVGSYFEFDDDSPYMLQTVPVRTELRLTLSDDADFAARVAAPTSTIPAVTHVDFSARIQTVTDKASPHLHAVLSAFEQLTGCPVLVNTSFNVRGEPLVCTPEDAYRCFIHTGIDYLAIGSFLLDRSVQPPPRDPPPRFQVD